MKRIIIAAVMVMTVGAALLAASTTAGAAGPGAVITFDDANNVVTLQIPNPPCPTTEPGCVWKFFLNEPKVSVDVATVYGTSGTLTLAYPANFCGVIQADAYIGPTANGPWTPQRGWQHSLADDCTPAPTPIPPSSPVQPVPPPDASPVVTTPPVTIPATQDASDAPVAATVTTPTTLPDAPVVKATAEPTTLPFTGVNLMPFVLSGVTCVALGLGLLVGRRKRPL